MNALVPRDTIDPFRKPGETLGDLSADVAAMVIAAASDIALVIDGEGVIRDIATGGEDLPWSVCSGWIGRPWIDTVTIESRPKIEALLEAASQNQAPRWRQVNHPVAEGSPDLPIRYAAVQMPKNGVVIGLGRDLRPLASLQQRLLDTQLALEKDYIRSRNAETRYRLLFQAAAEAVLIIDAATARVSEANPAAMLLLGKGKKSPAGKFFADLFDPSQEKEVQERLKAIRVSGRVSDVHLLLRDGKRHVMLAASLFRHEDAAHILVRLSVPGNEQGEGLSAHASRLLQLVENMPDAFVVTRPDGRIITANTAFLEMAELASAEQAVGETLDRWLGRSGVDADILFARVREHGLVRHFATVLRGEYGLREDIELSAVSVPDPQEGCFGFIIRSIASRPAPENPQQAIPQSSEELTELVGRVSLKDLVRETTDMIERLYIEAALKLTGDNRASAAELLGLSRQSLYVKLRRYGLGELGPEAEK